jgi:hypothetical protein
MLYKIIPFLAWFGVYSPHVGRAKLPALADMYSTRLQILGYWTFLGGWLVTGAAIVAASESGVRIGSTLLVLSVVTLAVNVGKILWHFARPQVTPFAVAKTNSPVSA